MVNYHTYRFFTAVFNSVCLMGMTLALLCWVF